MYYKNRIQYPIKEGNIMFKKFFTTIILSFVICLNSFSAGGKPNFNEIIYTGKCFVLFGSIGGSSVGIKIGKGVLYTSKNGINFNKINISPHVPLSKTATNGKITIVLEDAIKLTTGVSVSSGTFYSSAMFRSLDYGRTWEEIPGIYGKKARRERAFVIAGRKGFCKYSFNGRNWQHVRFRN